MGYNGDPPRSKTAREYEAAELSSFRHHAEMTFLRHELRGDFSPDFDSWEIVSRLHECDCCDLDCDCCGDANTIEIVGYEGIDQPPALFTSLAGGSWFGLVIATACGMWALAIWKVGQVMMADQDFK